jgi:AraC-like DNA-binding protein
MLSIMNRLVNLLEFAASPIGRAVHSRHTMLWFCAPRLSVVSLWGRPDQDDMAQLEQAMDADWAFRTEPFSALIDLRRLQGIDEHVVAQYATALTARQDRQHRILRCAVVLPPDGWLVRAIATVGPPLDAAASSGGHSMLYQVFSELAPALAWLPGFDAASLTDFDGLVEQAQADAVAADALHQYLLANLTRAIPLTTAARELGVSARTLQRRLRQAKMTFQDELAKARIERAKELLRTTDLKLFTVAQEVGYKKQQNFTAVFRKLVGKSPAEWRAQPRPR